jgi:hypothetical protein
LLARAKPRGPPPGSEGPLQRAEVGGSRTATLGSSMAVERCLDQSMHLSTLTWHEGAKRETKDVVPKVR